MPAWYVLCARTDYGRGQVCVTIEATEHLFKRHRSYIFIGRCSLSPSSETQQRCARFDCFHSRVLFGRYDLRPILVVRNTIYLYLLGYRLCISTDSIKSNKGSFARRYFPSMIGLLSYALGVSHIKRAHSTSVCPKQ